MSNEQTLEIRIASQDAALIGEIESALAQVNAKRWEQTRDLATVLTIASSAVALVKALLDLKDRLQKKPAAAAATTRIYVLNADRQQLAIADVTDAKLVELIEAAKD